ncbi:uncharacterized protein EI90DRAFT_2923834, partial [Cantharellus anzutake]|uniref:uncharacterized protein n=1 Tax=Cantharellus anzutake TaxID=1750568 RepID=UPI0019032672
RKESSPTPSAITSDHETLTAAERRQRQALEYGEEDFVTDVIQQRIADVPIPKLPLPSNSDGNHWIIRMPNFVKIDSQPFHPDTYRGPEADLDLAEQAETIRERSMSIKLEVENTIRWRWAARPNGEEVQQSNTRMIRWSDGSMSLQVGKEIFDIAINVDNSAAIPRAGAQTGPQTPARQASADQSVFPTGPVQAEGLSYLVAQHKSSAVLQAEALITGVLSLRPTGMQSETHKRLVRAVGQKHNKVARLRIAPEMIRDLDSEKATSGKKRKSMAGARKKYDVDSDSDGGLERRRRQQRRSSHGRNRSSRNVYSDDEEEEEEPEAVATDEDEESGTRKRRPIAKPKREIAGSYEADDFVVDDPPSEKDGDEEEQDQPEEEDGEPDDLDKIDQQIERQTRQRRQEAPKHSDHNAEEDSVDMDMSESEGDQSPGVVRKPAAPGRKKIIIEDEDE